MTDAYRDRLLAARNKADERASDLNHQDGHEVTAADYAGQGNAYSLALAWWDEEHEQVQGELL